MNMLCNMCALCFGLGLLGWCMCVYRIPSPAWDDMRRVCVLRVFSLIGVHISTLLQVKLGREMELGVIFWICFLCFIHSLLHACKTPVVSRFLWSGMWVWSFMWVLFKLFH